MTLNELRWFTHRLLTQSPGAVKIRRDPASGLLVVCLYSSSCELGRGKDAIEAAIAVAKWAVENARREAAGR